MQRSPLEYVPNDVIFSIFNFLGFENLLPFGLTNKRHAQLVFGKSIFWQQLSQTYFPGVVVNDGAEFMRLYQAAQDFSRIERLFKLSLKSDVDGFVREVVFGNLTFHNTLFMQD